MQTRVKEIKENRSGIETRKQGNDLEGKKKNYKKVWNLKRTMWIVDASLVTKFLNPMIKGKGQRSNKPENICKHAETCRNSAVEYFWMISILFSTFQTGL